MPIQAEYRQGFFRIRDSLNGFLDAESDEFSIADQGPDGGPAQPLCLRRRYVLDTFIYGGVSHNNVQKRETLASWRSHPLTFAVMSHIFSSTLAEMLLHIIAIKRLNDRVLAEMV